MSESAAMYTRTPLLYLADHTSLSRYDRNALRVDNVLGAQVGHIPRKLMEKLAPYIDSGYVNLEGVITGEKSVCASITCPLCELKSN